MSNTTDRFAKLKKRVAEGDYPAAPNRDFPDWVENYEGDAVENLTDHKWDLIEDHQLADAVFMDASEAFGAGLAIGSEAETTGRARRRARIEYIVRMILDDPAENWEKIKTLCSLMYLEGTDEAFEGDDDPDPVAYLEHAYPEVAALPKWEQD